MAAMGKQRERSKSSMTANELATALRRRVEGYLPGSRLPGREQLIRLFGASDYAVRKALQILTEEGLVEARHREGIVVTEHRSRSGVRKVQVLLEPRPIPLYQQTVLLGIDEQCRRQGLHLTVNRNPPDLRKPGCLAGLAVGDPSETAWALLSTAPPDETLANWQMQVINFVLIDSYNQGIQVNSVARDLQGTLYQATERLILLGHRRIAFVGMHDPETRVAAERLRGYQLALQRHGIVPEEALVVTDSGQAGSTRSQVRQMLLDSRQKGVTAVVAADQRIGCEALSACADAGVSVPEDVSVVSGGASLRLPPENHHRLSRFDEGPPQTLGQMAVDLLVNAPSQLHPTRLLTGSRWIDCGSTAAPPSDVAAKQQ